MEANNYETQVILEELKTLTKLMEAMNSCETQLMYSKEQGLVGKRIKFLMKSLIDDKVEEKPTTQLSVTLDKKRFLQMLLDGNELMNDDVTTCSYKYDESIKSESPFRVLELGGHNNPLDFSNFTEDFPSGIAWKVL